MSRFVLLLVLSPLLLLSLASDKSASPTLLGKSSPLPSVVTGLANPHSVTIGADGRTYVTVTGERGKDGDGGIVVIQRGKAVPFTTGLNDPIGIVAWQQFLFVVDGQRVLRVDRKGKAEVYLPSRGFPRPPRKLRDIEVDAQGTLYLAEAGEGPGKGGAIYRISPNKKVSILTEYSKDKRLIAPEGVKLASEYHLDVLEGGSGELLQVRLQDGKVEKLAEGLGGGGGLARDYFGRLYLADRTNGKLFVQPRPEDSPILLATGFTTPSDLCLTREGKSILVVDSTAGTLTEVPTTVPGRELDERRLAVQIEPAFADLQWAGWQGVTDSGKVVPHRPIVLTHAGDGSGRIFLATQHGVIHTFPNDQKAKKTKIFLDIQDRVRYDDNQNEEGFLGLAFHPRFKENREFFVFYTIKSEKLVNVLSRFQVSKEDPDRADPSSEQVLLRVKRPFWNHDGGTILFGPDGYLYVTLGDGGAANDPFGHGQNLRSLLGKVLRLDIDRKEDGLPYAIPRDNPFRGNKSARPEIWAYGFRNLWRMAFDSKTGRLWAADVGQNLWEEINLVEKGGNYGWNLREGLHPFGFKGVGPNREMIDPIWEYHHDIGKSITGGHVYRGSRVKALEGLYLYADYVSGNIWALRYDEEKRRVTANHTIRKGGFPVFSFGEDDRGEVYLLTSTPTGKGIFWFTSEK